MAKEKTINEFVGLAIAGGAALAAGHALGNTKPMKKLAAHIGYEGDRHVAHQVGIETMQANDWDYSHDGGQGKDHHTVWTHPKHGTIRLGGDWWDHKNKSGKTVAKGKPGYDFHVHMVDNKKLNPSGNLGYVDESVDVITKQDRVLKKVLDMRADLKKAFTGGNERSDRFLGKHPVSRTDDPEGNGDDVFKATNVAKDTTNSAKDLLPGEDEYVYEGKEPEIHNHFYTVSAHLDRKAEKSRHRDLKSLYHSDAKDYRDIGDLAAAGNHEAAKKKWHSLDTASRDNIAEISPKHHGQIAKYLNVSINGVTEEVMSLTEKLNPKMGAKAYIDDFVHSKDPRFEGKTRAERARMALGAFYGARKKLKEGIEPIDEMSMGSWSREKYGKNRGTEVRHGEMVSPKEHVAAAKPWTDVLQKHGFVSDEKMKHNRTDWRNPETGEIKTINHTSSQYFKHPDISHRISVHVNERENGGPVAHVSINRGLGNPDNRSAKSPEHLDHMIRGMKEFNESVSNSLREASHLTAFHPSSVKERAGLAAHLGTQWHHDYDGNHVGLASGDSGELHRKMLELGYTPGLSDHPHDARVDARDQEYFKDGDNHTRHRVTFKKRRTSSQLHDVEIEHSK